ncbi:MAG TPA: SUMF1/EgtB/PvdO family nonheme iron enzyme [Polyangiaceae bacterium]|nr:SUMF1/EgtB/PvdO family nonheme iron enzyme [Polyangiaceae bacterium]
MFRDCDVIEESKVHSYHGRRSIGRHARGQTRLMAILGVGVCIVSAAGCGNSDGPQGPSVSGNTNSITGGAMGDGNTSGSGASATAGNGGASANSTGGGSTTGGVAMTGAAGQSVTGSGGRSPSGGASGVGGQAQSGGQSGSAGAGASGGINQAGRGGIPGDGGRAANGGSDTAGSGAGGNSTGATGGASGGASMGPPSCATAGPGRTTCGEKGDESCCSSPTVEGGTYSRTYKNTGSGATEKADAATISSFRLDKYEVTVARFREYVKYLENGGSPPAAGSGKHAHLNGGKGLADSGKSGAFEAGWDASWSSKIPSGAGATAKWKALLTAKGTNANSGCNIYGSWSDESGKNDSLPITCTSWYESYAFCIWDGGFLPSEAEWKFAAAGGDEQRAYPWGSTAPGASNDYAIWDCCYPSGQCSGASGRDTCTGLVNVAPVGFAKKGAGRYGQLDLVGSVWEWLVDRYADKYGSPCQDCAYLTGNTANRVLPGAGFHTGASLGATLMYSWNRSQISYNADTYRGDYAVGLRCARSP